MVTLCPNCQTVRRVNADGTLRMHKKDQEICKGAGKVVAEDQQTNAPESARHTADLGSWRSGVLS